MNLKRLAKRALATLSLSMLCLIAFAQGHQISGTVIDGTGEPIIGASVLVKGLLLELLLIWMVTIHCLTFLKELFWNLVM
mgnify:CR=1 FL=1